MSEKRMFEDHIDALDNGSRPPWSMPHRSCGGYGCHGCNFRGWVSASVDQKQLSENFR
jgi:hypothetical protein